jgi:putative alpha-1,2-mannosidase
MGFYPVNPVSGDYMIGSPLFTKLALTLQGGRRLVISAPRNSPNNLYMQSARLNGKPIDIPIVTYQQIEVGGLLEFEMGPTSSSWGSAWSGTPLPSGR